MAAPIEIIERAEYKKKKKKAKDSAQGDDFNPFVSGDIRETVEIPVKEIKTEDVEKVEKKGRKLTKKIVGSKVKEKSERVEKISKKEYELIITEKPQAAFKIANALANDGIDKKNVHRVPYYELTRQGKKIIVACAVGHLFTLSQKEKGSGWPIFDIEWKPNFKVKKKDFTKKYYDVISRLAENADEIIVATDYDVEGEVIGLNVMRYICKREDAERMKFSTLTANEIQEAYEHKSKTLNWNQAIAGETRHFLDWIYGINLSRALMSAIKKAGSFKIMSIGRVQGPTLKLIVNKEKQIQAFKPEPYWQVFLHVKDKSGNEIEVKHVKDLSKKEKDKLELFKNLKGKQGQAETKKTEDKIPPLTPFDLTTLQTEAYKFFGITPTTTLQIAQQLYLLGLISYPRTSSQKLPEIIGYKNILQRLYDRFSAAKYAIRAKPIEGKKSDPAHPSIYPTGEFALLAGQEKKVYELIVKRFIACFSPDAVMDYKKIEVLVDNLKFDTRGLSIKEKGWLNVYPAKFQEKELPDINGTVDVLDVKIEEKITQPPKRYSPASIVSELEKRNLGTKSTRAAIIETLYNRGYVKGTSIEATPLGMKLIESLEKNSPIIIDEKLTRHFEREMSEIEKEKSKKLKEKQQKVLQETKETLIKISENFKEKELQIGKDLVEANGLHMEALRKENEIMDCPVCKKGRLRILFNRNSKRYFMACSAYPECKTTFTLPPNSLIKNANKQCELCEFSKLLAIRKGKRPWEFCFNPECESRKQQSNNNNKNN